MGTGRTQNGAVTENAGHLKGRHKNGESSCEFHAQAGLPQGIKPTGALRRGDEGRMQTGTARPAGYLLVREPAVAKADDCLADSSAKRIASRQTH